MKSLPLIGNLMELARDPLRFLTRLHNAEGDIAFFSMGIAGNAVLLSDPHEVEKVFLQSGKIYSKGEYTFISERVFGNGLVMSEGDLWKRQRKLAAPALQHSAIKTYAEDMVRLTVEMLEKWEAGQTRDLHQEMMSLTQKIVIKSLFGMDVNMTGESMNSDLDIIMDAMGDEIAGFEQFLPEYIPTPARKKFHGAIQRVNTLVIEIIEKRRKEAKEHHDLLGMLMSARDEQGRGMDDQLLLDEIRTLYIAGHETTATTLSWTWYALHMYPHVRDILEKELTQVLGGREPTFEDSRCLPYTEAIIKETLRLFPPAWTYVRVPVQDVEISGKHIKKGTTIWISPWVIHHDERWYDNADHYQPERWLEGREKHLPKYAFCAFGGGPRICIGNHFAMMEGVLLLATIAQRYRFELQEQNIRFMPSATLRPRKGLKMKLIGRSK